MWKGLSGVPPVSPASRMRHLELRQAWDHPTAGDGTTFRDRPNAGRGDGALAAIPDQTPARPAIIPSPTLTPGNPVPCHWRTCGPIERARSSIEVGVRTMTYLASLALPAGRPPHVAKDVRD